MFNFFFLQKKLWKTISKKCLVNCELDEIVFLINVVISAYDKVIVNQSDCKALWNVISTIFFFIVFFQLKQVELHYCGEEKPVS